MSETRFWHGFADMHRVKDHEVVLVSGQGSTIRDSEGREYLDATGGLWFTAAGYGREEIARAAAEQMTRLHHYSAFGAYVPKPTLALAERLAVMAPIPDARVFLTSGGSEGIETAAKLARRYWDVVGRPERAVIVSREFGYHGMAAYGTSLAGIGVNRDGYGGALIPQVEFVPPFDVDALARLLEDHGDRVAAFIGEPVIGAGGVMPPPSGYWEAIRDLCRRHDVLVIADEVVCGFGRTGVTWGSERYGIKPDMVVFAKGATSGYLPLGGVLVGRRTWEPFFEGPPGTIFRHGYTYSGHAAACAAAMANLDILEREALVARVAMLEPVLDRELRRLEGRPGVGEVRTVGLTGAVELALPATAHDQVIAAAWRHGILTRLLRGGALHVSPPFVISETEIAAMVDGMAAAIADVAEGRPAAG